MDDNQPADKDDDDMLDMESEERPP